MSIRQHRRRSDKPRCARPNCPHVMKCRGLCAKHYFADLEARKSSGEFVPGMVDPQETVEHIEVMLAAGLSHRCIGELAGVHEDMISQLRRRRYPRIYANTAARILAVGVPTPPDAIETPTARILAIGTTRRLQSLVAMGHAQRVIASSMGMHERNLTRLVQGHQRTVTVTVARRVDAGFQRLQMVPGTNVRALARARRNGWPPAFAWDDDNIDDPAATPYENERVAPIRNNAGSRAVPADFLEIVADHRSLGRSDEEIARRLGVLYETFQSRLQRLRRAAS